MSDIVEKLRGLRTYRREYGHGLNFAVEGDDVDTALADAIAEITRLREPTEAMIEAGVKVLEEPLRKFNVRGRVKRIYRVMQSLSHKDGMTGRPVKRHASGDPFVAREMGMRNDKLNALAIGCEQATGPDRELDRAIQLAIRKSVPSDKWTGRDEILPQKPRHFTASLDAAMTLVPEGARFYVDNGTTDDGESHACVYLKGRFSGGSKEAATSALALCAAALRARASQEEQS